ncbi:adenylate kinase [Methanosphaerula subterraneus]|uniref:adenylate kinase n=1 Tax=Methanosphaerula subterraneus TaxID=3350244 RepID=UPI003F875402
MPGRKIIITGVPGVGKTTVINESILRLKEEGVDFQSISFGSFMFEMAVSKGLVKDRDDMRKLSRDEQKHLQQLAAAAIGKINGDVIIDTHASVKTPKGYLAGLPEWVLRELKPDVFVIVETDEDQILLRRLSDMTRVRDVDGFRALSEHQEFNRAIAAAYAMVTGCTVKIIKNPDHLLDKAVSDMVNLLR